MGVPWYAGAVSAILKSLKDLSLDEVVQEYPSVTREQVLCS